MLSIETEVGSDLNTQHSTLNTLPWGGRVEALQLLLQQLINGIQLGSVYALIAVGYTMVYGVLQFINFAHGDIYMVGAYMGMFTVLGFHTKDVNPQAMTIVLAMVLFVALLVSLRGHWRDPKGILL